MAMPAITARSPISPASCPSSGRRWRWCRWKAASASSSPAPTLMLPQAKLLTWVEDVRPFGNVPKLVAEWLAEQHGATLATWGGRVAGARASSRHRRALYVRLGAMVALDDALDSIRRQKSPRELDLMRRAGKILAASAAALAAASRGGAGARTAALAAERAAIAAGAQDVRALASLHGRAARRCRSTAPRTASSIRCSPRSPCSMRAIGPRGTSRSQTRRARRSRAPRRRWPRCCAKHGRAPPAMTLLRVAETQLAPARAPCDDARRDRTRHRPVARGGTGAERRGVLGSRARPMRCASARRARAPMPPCSRRWSRSPRRARKSCGRSSRMTGGV